MFEEENINDHFKLPIEYNKNKNTLNKSIHEDLELKDNENTVGLYNYVYDPKNKFAKNIIKKYRISIQMT